MSNYDKLMDAGLLNPKEEFTPEQQKVIEGLSDQEVADLIAGGKKGGTEYLTGADVLPSDILPSEPGEDEAEEEGDGEVPPAEDDKKAE